ncbi:hypothetical protein O6H91_15G054700 [Diphasiastrum complanatum]|uniref:Uncharacterized protein n=7 Tax=Diphasiastrum complanatum TaxID=34168 RepID=A0ACC2BIC4_DIPCM|nr:hypothetical protein O6H91_15G054700 [Diphasiastrum complanatum]KAJ7529519.1 hypothetical protein O6H91_15G054700 [Diphasiastrum complanatum]KAJ7529520.1 hypothetical protein O6H91_15G054700 [Diphasiastrum complanatum]KAJ7529521.1 hypothetical protein O6H91_15G054700 [Diphasiastrum complanatum]KAJ7529522.1 hypothetical protein O6H91_15G054700 [Diphasiastrum complanatum]
MAHSGNHQKLVGDYIVLHEIGTGSFAVVWKAVHRFDGHEVAIKEIATERLNKKLQDNLSSEIAILRKTDHPNIIRLHDIVEAPNRLYLILEYCAGGDLAAYIQRHGKVAEEVARHFMRQLGSGLQVLHVNNLIHRDLKPQNLLLSTNNQNAVLKIADFGFARSLQPQGMAETLCGSPLYMAPEILRYQKYDAKADLWSVGAIFFHLLTGRPPFVGNSHAQLLQNISKSEAQFSKSVVADLHPDCIDLCRKLLRQNPVERLSFEEFVSHSFLGLLRPKAEDVEVHLIGSAASESNENSQDTLPFLLDDEPRGIVEIPAVLSKQSLFSASSINSLIPKCIAKEERISLKRFPPEEEDHMKEMGRSPLVGLEDKQRASCKQPLSGISRFQGSTETRFLESSTASTGIQVTDEHVSIHASSSKGVNLLGETTGILVDSMELIERDYVLVNASMDTFSLSLSTSASGNHGSKGASSPQRSPSKLQTPSVPVPVVATSGGSFGGIGSVGSHGSTPPGTSQESFDSGDMLEGPSTYPPTRLSSLEGCAQLITELASDKLDAGQSLESFSVQLICLAIWKEALQVCCMWAAVANSPLFEELGNVVPRSSALQGTVEAYVYEGTVEGGQEAAAALACSRMEQEFLLAVERAEDLATHIGNTDGSLEMPDAIEIIFQEALAVGRVGAAEELIGNVTYAAKAYSKSAALLYFLLVEGSSLPLVPPLVLSPSDRYRLRRYANMLTARLHQCALLQQVEQQSSS